MGCFLCSFLMVVKVVTVTLYFGRRGVKLRPLSVAAPVTLNQVLFSTPKWIEGI